MSTATRKSWADHVWETARKTRTLLFSTDVRSGSVAKTIDQLLALEADDADKPITLIINPPGGSVSDGYALVDIIRFIRPPVRIVGTGMVASMGISLLISTDADRRFSLPNTRFMLHQPRYGGVVRGLVSDLEISAKEMIKLKDKANEEVANATGQPVDKVDKDTRRDLWLSAQEALDYGLVCRILQSVSELE